MELNDYDSDTELDERADFTEDILEEIKLDKIFNSINKFKDLIKKEPDFYGIEMYSACEIYHKIKNLKIKNYKGNLTKYQYELFEDLYDSIGENGNKHVYGDLAASFC